MAVTAHIGGARAGLAALACLALVACSARGKLALDPGAAEVGSVETMFVATARQAIPAFPFFGDGRAFETGYARFAISVPPDRQPGRVRFPSGDQVNPARDFAVVDARRLDGRKGFVAALDRAVTADPRDRRDVALFVHGFNTNFAEGLVRQAQIQHDLQGESVAVQFAWPSRARSTGYLYDRESVVFSRASMEQALQAIAASKTRQINVFAHSMGTQLTMDTLNIMARTGNDAVFAKLNSVVLVEADMEIDVFRKLAPAVLARGVRIFLIVSRQDRALEISSRLRGETDRLGSLRDRAELGGLDVPVIDLTQVRSPDLLGHLKAGENPALLDFLGSLGRSGLAALEGSETDAFLRGGVSLIQQGANIVLAPLQ